MDREQPARVLFLIDNLRPGGAQKALLEIARAVQRTRLQPVVWRLGGTSDVENRFRDAGVPILGGAESVWGGAGQAASLLRYFLREDVVLVMTLLFYSDVTGRVAGSLARLLSGRRTPVVISSARATNRRNRWWQFALLQLTAPLADAFTAVSRNTLEFAARREGLRRERAVAIPNGIDMAPWQTPPPQGEARAALGLPPDDLVFVAVGRLDEQKGHEFLLRALPAVLARFGRGVTLALAGYGPLRDALETRAREIGVAENVRFLGYRQDLPVVLAAADVFVLPSLWEGMSNALLEAMAAGKPVIATRIDGNVEQVAEEETGLLVPPADAAALADAMIRLGEDRGFARRLGEAGRRRVEREFTRDAMTTRYLDLFAELLQQRAGIAPETWRKACRTCPGC